MSGRFPWLDSSGAHLTVRVNGLSLKTSKGETLSLGFLPVSLDTVADFTPANAFDYLASVPALLPADAESLVVNFTLCAEDAEKVASGNNPKISLEFKNSNEQSLTKVSGPTFKASGTIPEKALRFAVPLGTVKQAVGSANTKAVVKVEGLTSKTGVFASLGHIYDFNKSAESQMLAQQPTNGAALSPDRFDLAQNYPNPFNPETIIKYQINSPSAVSLKIYNLRGQVVRTLLDAVQNSGNHEVTWDSRDNLGNEVASGVYVYRLSVLPNGAGGQPFEAVRKMTLLR